MIILILLLFSINVKTYPGYSEAIEQDHTFSLVQDSTRHWSTFTDLSINVDSNHEDPVEEFFAFVDTPGSPHRILITPSWWAAMEGRTTPKIGLEVKVYDPWMNLFREELIAYESTETLTIAFNPSSHGKYVVRLIEAYGESNDWDTNFGWELGNVRLDFIGFKYVYFYQDEIDIDFRRFRCTGIGYSYYLFLDKHQQSSLDFLYRGNWEDDYTPIYYIAIYHLDGSLLTEFNLSATVQFSETVTFPYTNALWRVEVSEKPESWGMGYVFTFRNSTGFDLPVFLSNLSGYPPTLKDRVLLEDFNTLVAMDSDLDNVSTSLSTNIVKQGYASNRVTFDFPNTKVGWVELFLRHLDDPFNFSFLDELSIWLYGDGSVLNFYIYLNNARWSDTSHTDFDFYGAMFAKIQISHSGWRQIYFSKDDFTMVQFDSFDFSHVESISLGIEALQGPTSGIIYFDAFEASFIEPQISFPSEIESSLTSVLMLDTPGQDLVITLISCCFLIYFPLKKRRDFV